MFLQVLGPLDMTNPDDQPLRVNGNKQRLLLACLALQAGDWISSRRLTELLWEGDPPDSAAANLKTYIWELRRALPATAGDGRRIESRRGGSYRLVAERDEIDLLVFEDLLAAGRDALNTGNLVTAQRTLSSAVGLWRDDPLANVPLPAALEPERSRLVEQRWAAVEQLYDIGLSLGQHVSLVADIKRSLEQNPLREALWGQLMTALYRSGRRAEALETYYELGRRLGAQLGIDPGPDLQHLHKLILNDDPQLQSPAPGDVARLPRSATPPAYLPPDLNSFTGREAEMRAVLDLVDRSDALSAASVLISSIDGMAGVGKTMLAVHISHRLTPLFPDGQLFVDLHGFTPDSEPVDAQSALDHLLHQLGVPAEVIPPSPQDRAALYRRRLAGTRTLIVLDNAASEDQVRPLLPGTPGSLVLITSRRRMTDVDDLFPVSLDVLPMPEAVRLFCAVAGIDQAGQDIGLVHEVVRLCGQLPLALRICGVRLRSRPNWDVAHLVDRLRRSHGALSEMTAGQRSVEAAIQLSYQQLNEPEQVLFRALGLHVGTDVDSYAAAALTGFGVLEADQLLESLVDANLLNSDLPGRYRMHDLVFQHAGRLADQQIPEPERRAAVTRLLDYWLAVTAAAATELLPLQPPLTPTLTFPPRYRPECASAEEYVQWFELERANLVLAVSHCRRHGLDDHAWQLAYAIGGLFHLRGHIDDWMTTQEEALRASVHLGDCAERAELLKNVGIAQWMLGNSERTLRHCHQALTMLRAIGDKVGQVHMLVHMGLVYWRLGQYLEALSCEQEGRAIALELGDQNCWLRTAQLLGLTYWRIGRYQAMTELFEHTLDVAQRLDSSLNQADSLNALGLAKVRLGRHDEALEHQLRANEIHQRRGDRWGQIHSHNGIGMAQIGLGRPDQAIAHQQQAIALSRYLSDRWGEAQSLNILGQASLALDKPLDAMTYWEQSLAIVGQIADPGLECDVRNGLGAAHHRRGPYDDAVRCHRQALAIAERIGEPYETARAHVGLARVLAPADDVAATHLEQAARIYRETCVPESSQEPS